MMRFVDEVIQVDPISAFDFGEIVPGVPTWVPLVAQLIPWVVGLAVDADAENRQRVLVSAVLSGLIAIGNAMTVEGGATLTEALTVFLAALLSAQVGYGVSKGLSNGKINELSNRRKPTLPPGYQPPYAWPQDTVYAPAPSQRRSSYQTPSDLTRNLVGYTDPSDHHTVRRHPTQELPTVNPQYQRTVQHPIEQQAATTFNYPTPEPEPPPSEGGRSYI